MSPAAAMPFTPAATPMPGNAAPLVATAPFGAELATIMAAFPPGEGLPSVPVAPEVLSAIVPPCVPPPVSDAPLLLATPPADSIVAPPPPTIEQLPAAEAGHIRRAPGAVAITAGDAIRLEPMPDVTSSAEAFNQAAEPVAVAAEPGPAADLTETPERATEAGIEPAPIQAAPPAIPPAPVPPPSEARSTPTMAATSDAATGIQPARAVAPGEPVPTPEMPSDARPTGPDPAAAPDFAPALAIDPAPGAPSARDVERVTPPAPPAEPTVAARPGQAGRELGLEIARVGREGGDELIVRLDPAELGRVEVRLAWDEGVLGATVRAEHPAALELFRREVGDLGRALSEAGVRADTGAFRFEGGSGDGRHARSDRPGEAPASAERDAPRPPSTTAPEVRLAHGRVDLIA